METSLSYLISSSTMKSPSQHAHAACPLLESPAGVCSLSPHPLPFAIPCESSKHFYAFLLPLSGPKRCAWVEAAAPFPCSFLTSASCSLLPVIMRSSRSAGISSPGSPAGPTVLSVSRALGGGLGNSLQLITPALQSRLGKQPRGKPQPPAALPLPTAAGWQRAAGGNWPRGGWGVVWGVFLSSGACCWMEVAGAPHSLWIAASCFRDIKACRLGHAQGA